MIPQLIRKKVNQCLTTHNDNVLTISQAVTYFTSTLAKPGNYPRIVRRYLEECVENNYSIDQISFSIYAAGKKGNLVSPVKKFLGFAHGFGIVRVIADPPKQLQSAAANTYILAFLADSGSLRGDRSKQTYLIALNDFFDFLNAESIIFSGQLVEKYLRHLKDENKSAFTVNNYLSAIRQFARWLIRRREHLNLQLTQRQLEYLREVADVRGLVVEGKFFKEDLSELERDQLIGNITQLRTKAMVSLMAYCGLRTVELTRLKIADIDIVRSRILVLSKGQSTKRVIKLFSICSNVLEEYMATLPDLNRDSSLFPSLTTRQVRYYTDKYLNKLHLKRHGISAHSLRHTAAQRLLDKGADLLHIKNQLGHKRLTTTQYYVAKHAQEVFLEKLPD